MPHIALFSLGVSSSSRDTGFVVIEEIFSQTCPKQVVSEVSLRAALGEGLVPDLGLSQHHKLEEKTNENSRLDEPGKYC